MWENLGKVGVVLLLCAELLSGLSRYRSSTFDSPERLRLLSRLDHVLRTKKLPGMAWNIFHGIFGAMECILSDSKVEYMVTVNGVFGMTRMLSPGGFLTCRL